MPEMLKTTAVIARREFAAYFATPLAAVFLTIFVALTGAFAFYIGGFFELAFRFLDVFGFGGHVLASRLPFCFFL